MMFQDPDESYSCSPIKGQNPIINTRPDYAAVLHSRVDSVVMPDSLSAIVV